MEGHSAKRQEWQLVTLVGTLLVVVIDFTSTSAVDVLKAHAGHGCPQWATILVLTATSEAAECGEKSCKDVNQRNAPCTASPFPL